MATLALRGARVALPPHAPRGLPSRCLATTGSSQRWLQRQRTDPLSRGNHASRAWFKLEQVDKKYRLFPVPGNGGVASRADNAGPWGVPKPLVVVDLGSAPGGWTEYASQRLAELSATVDAARVVSVDLLPLRLGHLANTIALQGDLRDAATRANVLAASRGGVVSLVLSDMAPNTTGDRDVDHFRSSDLAGLAMDVAAQCLAPGGAFLCKVGSPQARCSRKRAFPRR